MAIMETHPSNTHVYQAMFLLDNQEVRQDGFNAVRDSVRQTLEKHGLTPRVLRLWGERELAYPIGGRTRATYLLGWLEGSGDAVNRAKRDFYLVGPVFRVLFTREDEIPAEELAFGIQEISDEEVVIPEEVEEPEEEAHEEPVVETAAEAAAAGETTPGQAEAKDQPAAEAAEAAETAPVAAESVTEEERKDG